MDFLVPLLIGGALPIVTLLINRIFDYKNIKRTHELSLSKEYFIRKLSAFENATSYYSIAHYSINNISIIFNLVNNENATFSEEVVKNMFGEIQKNLNAVYAISQKEALSLPLYTDSKLPDEDENHVERYFELLGRMNLTLEVYNLNQAEILKEIDPTKKLTREAIAEDLLKELSQEIDELVTLSSLIKVRYQEFTRSLRKQLLVFDITPNLN